jgi:hypothetical protein
LISKIFVKKKITCLNIDICIQNAVISTDIADFLYSSPLKPLGEMNRNLVGSIYHRCFLSSFGSFGQTVSEKKIFRNRPIRNKNGLWQPCLLTDWDKMSNLYREPAIDASY